MFKCMYGNAETIRLFQNKYIKHDLMQDDKNKEIYYYLNIYILYQSKHLSIKKTIVNSFLKILSTMGFWI